MLEFMQRRGMRKYLIIAISLLPLLSACSGNNDVITTFDEQVTVQLWYALNDTNEQYFNDIIDQFNSENENITIEATNKKNAEDLHNDLVSAQTENQLPTLVCAYPSEIYEYIENDQIATFNDFDKNDELGLNLNNFTNAYISELTDKEGNVYAIPFSKSTEVLYYNQDVIEQLDLSMPQTLDDALKISEDIYKQTGMAGIGFNSVNNLLATILYLNGSYPWYENEQYNFDTESVIADLTKLQEAVNKGYVRISTPSEFLSVPFAKEEVAMFVGSTAGVNYIQADIDGKVKWDATVYPAPVAIQQGTSIAMFNTASDYQQAAAVKFIGFLMSDEVIVPWSIKTNYLPPTKSALESEQYQEYLTTNKVANAAYEQVDNIHPLVPLEHGSQEIYQTYMKATMRSILDENADVTKSLNQLTQDALTISKNK